MTDLLTTPLDGLSRALGGRMVDFAGYALPVQFPTGVMKEHLHTRAAASLFDVSHMGQAILRGAAVAERLEAMIPADLAGLAEGQQRYGLFTSEAGGILDDLMVANRGEDHLIVVNAARKAHDFGLLSDAFGADFMPVSDRALIALQGPAAEAALGAMVPAAAGLRFMEVTVAEWQGAALWISRSGYSGEDGFEISVPAARAEGFARALLENPAVLPAGLGAPLYGKLDADLAAAMMSINAVKGVEIGAGMAAAALTGSANADEIRMGPDGPEFLSNHAGGILGGISTGQPVVVRFAVKPTSSILTPRRTITAAGEEVEIQTKGRHDPCVGIRAVPVGEAMMALVLADHLLRDRGQTGGVRGTIG